MFTIWEDRLEVDTYPRLIWRDGDRLFLVLAGVNIVGGNFEPVYIPLLRVWKTPGIVYVQTPWLLIMLMRRQPHIHLERSKGIELEDE